MRWRRTNHLLSAIFLLAVIVLTITFSIGLPIYIRPFYYAHIPSIQKEFEEELDISVPREVIVEAYDEVLDFLTLDGHEFGTGQLEFSEEGKGHFEDCKILFDLNKYAFIVSLGVILLLGFLNLIRVIKLSKPFGLSLFAVAGLITLISFGALAFAIAKDFTSAFTIFHKIFFPGKDNWLFNPYTDPIILFMPQRFFMSCAILICSSILAISTVFVVRGFKRRYW